MLFRFALLLLVLLLLLLCDEIRTSQIEIEAGNGNDNNDDNRKPKIVAQWRLLEYGFPTERDREEALANGNLIPQNGIPIDVAPHYNKQGDLRVFVSIPRFQTGIPYTLATVRPNTKQLEAYPSYNWHNSHGGNCDGITSAFRAAFTPCNQMWVIDSGLIAGAYHCPPQLLLFDLATDQLVHRYRFNSTLHVPVASIFIVPVLQVRDPPPGRCRDTMVYVADVNYHGLVVYDFRGNTAWRVENKYMYPDPDYGTHTIAGESFTLMDGIFGLAVDNRNLYFHPLASVSEYAVPLQVLDNRANWAQGGSPALQDTFRPLGMRSSECAAQTIDSGHNVYCVTFNPIKLISWNTRKPYAEQYFCELPANRSHLEFVSGMKVVRNFFREEELWLLSNRFQKIAAGTQNPAEINYRILKAKISDMLSAGQCIRAGLDLHNALIFN